MHLTPTSKLGYLSFKVNPDRKRFRYSCVDTASMLAHWIKPRNNQSAIFLPAFGRSIRVLHNADR